jgi:hypothetical protein
MGKLPIRTAFSFGHTLGQFEDQAIAAYKALLVLEEDGFVFEERNILRLKIDKFGFCGLNI